jgi:acetyl/propionyl-CoA carboxylase alpha subunit
VVQITGGDGRFRVALGDEVWEVDARETGPGMYSLLVDGVVYAVDVSDGEGGRRVDVGGESYTVLVEEQTRHILRSRGGAAGAGGRTVTAPLPGRVTHVAVRAGDVVQAGSTLVVIEAMKMENELKVAAPGTVAEVRVQPGQAVNAGDVLIVIG